MGTKQCSAGLATVLNAGKVTKEKVSRHVHFIFLQFYIVQYFPIAVRQRLESTCVNTFYIHKRRTGIKNTADFAGLFRYQLCQATKFV